MIRFFTLLFISILYGFALQAQPPKENSYLLDKGTIHNGLTFKFNSEKVENEDRLLIIVEDRKTNSFEVNLDGGYFIKRNLAIGASVKHGGSRHIGVDVSPQNKRSEVNRAKRSWGVYGIAKLYIPMGESDRFFLFNNFMIGGTFDNTLTDSFTEKVLTRNS